MKSKIILASQSPQRRDIFQALGRAFEIIPARVDEQQIDDPDLVKRAEKIARLKATSVAKQHPEAIVIAADTYTTLGGRAFEKPASLEEAAQMLHDQSGQICVAVTGFCYLDTAHDLDFSTTVQNKFKFRSLTKHEIDNYVKNQPVTTWSAAFCPGYPSGAALIEWAEGSITSFAYGLPIELVAKLLQQSGVKI